ncbi:hypothetical protein PBY51_021170 [Eleginops maclovinus]|uniref:Coiled-coil domain-containing protein 150 n=1 Tax=Eleginops maclovinus TaxID=56733 RepID=A0AAN7XEY3_ELEMC|nr:hypothetical protein PBY51_021170 [Eleginops maclovinus]
MAADLRFILIPFLLSCVFPASDNRLVKQLDSTDLENILSKIPITLPEGIDPSHINVTSITIKTCTGLKEQLALLDIQLKQTTVRNTQLDNEAFRLRREARLLKLKLSTCSSTASAITGSYQTQLLNQMKQLLETSDSDTFLILKIIALNREVVTLQEKVKHAANATGTAYYRGLEAELQEKTNELTVKTQQIKKSNANSALILQIISLQNQIWNLEQAESRKRDNTLQHDNRILALQEQLNWKIIELRGKGDAHSTMLELVFVHSKIAAMQRLITLHSEVSRTNAADYQRQWKQKVELLKRKILLLNSAESNTALTRDIWTLQAEVQLLRQLMMDTKNRTDSQIEVVRHRLEEEKKREENLHKHLEEADNAQAQLILKILIMMEEVRELDDNTQHQTTSTIQAGTLQTLLQAKERELAKAQAEIKDLQRKLQNKTEECTSFEVQYEQLKTEFEQKIAELNTAGNHKAALLLNVINLRDDLQNLRYLIATSKDPNRVSELQRQLKKKQEELNSKTAEIERKIANPQIILSIVELQHEIWVLQNKAPNETTTGRVLELEDRVDGLLSEIEDNGDDKLLLLIMTLQSRVEHLQRQLSDLQGSQTSQKTQLTKDLASKKEELQKYINELTEKDEANAKLILTITGLHNKIRNLEKEKQNEGQKSSAALTELKEKLKVKEEKIRALQSQLNQTEAQCSTDDLKLKDLQNNLDGKMKELQSKSQTVTSLALQVSTLTVQLEELKRQLQNTESETKIKELQKIIDEKNTELTKKTEELKALSAQPQRFLQIIAIQTEIEKLVFVARNDTDYIKITALQDHLKYLIDGIQDEENEYTKLMFKILTQQDEIARLEKQQKSQREAASKTIKDLETQLEDLRNQIAEKTRVLDSSETRIANLTADILELHKKIKPLEEDISELKDKSSDNIRELQKKLDLTRRQLQDSELRLQGADTKNFNLVMEITDLRSQLKISQEKASKAAENNAIELKQQLQTQQRENRKLEVTNKDLMQEVQEMKTCCSNNVNTQCDDLQRQLQQSQEDADRLQQQLHEQDANLKQQQQDLEEMRRENNELRGAYNSVFNRLELNGFIQGSRDNYILLF